MKTLLRVLVLFLSLTAWPAWGAFTSVGSLGAAATVTTSVTYSLTTTAALEAGNIGLLCVAKDNTSTTDGNTEEYISVTDSAGNTYTKLREFTNGQGGAGAGATVAAYFTKATTTLASAGSVTITIDNAARRVKTMSMWEFTVGGGNTIQIAGTATDAAGDALDPPAQVISGLTSKEYLFWRCIGNEHNAGTVLTPTTNYTAITHTQNDDGTSALGMQVRGEFRILTGTGDTSDPTQSAHDNANIYLALEEVSEGVSTPAGPFRRR